MKKLLQFVALFLTLTVSAQPVLADSPCTQRGCGTLPTMACCPPISRAAQSMPAMPMDMTCGQSRPGASPPMHCGGHACCMVSAAIVPAIATASLSTPTACCASILPASLHILPTVSAAKRPPGPGTVPTTARYILYRDFRI
jgi:hypothetical protein